MSTTAEPEATDEEPAVALVEEARRALEAMIMVADTPADAAVLGQLVELGEAAVEELLEGLAAEYEAEGRGFRLVKVAGGWRYQSHEDQTPWVERFILNGQSARLSAAALETLAIVAYRQPTTRSEIEAIRGVGSEEMLRQLMERDFVAVGGRAEDLGRPNVYVTTRRFLAAFGLARLEDLPPLESLPGAETPPHEPLQGDAKA